MRVLWLDRVRRCASGHLCKHMRKQHPGCTARSRKLIKGQWQETSPGTPAGMGAWQCGFCRDAVRARWIARHLEQFHPGRSVAEANRALLGALNWW